ncbi:MAG: hypothetical protein JST59_28985 [Actinobacteria bacterium]|nr:hypothetical protein [Actinomycetota bacterium]
MRGLEPAVIVPDPGSWAIWGVDVQALGLRQAASPSAAAVLVAPGRLPPALGDAVSAAWQQMAPPRRLVELGGPSMGTDTIAEVLDTEARGSADDGDVEDGDHEMDESGDDMDMMEITGKPSRDGLVMESIQLKHGPLAPGLPGGLVLAAELDGDVVCSCEVGATLRAENGEDPLTPVANGSALRGGDGRLEQIVEIERERALSHLVWLASFGIVLGWEEICARSQRLVRSMIGIARPADLIADADRLLGTLEGSRRLARRTRGRGIVSAALAEARGLGGPNARASGLREDAREGEPLYGELGFSMRTARSGDVEARVLQRAGEIVDALRLAEAAQGLTDRVSTPSPLHPEGPRGRILVAGGHTVTQGLAAARSLAGELAAGLEWASALTVVASFDLSPWEAPR